METLILHQKSGDKRILLSASLKGVSNPLIKTALRLSSPKITLKSFGNLNSAQKSGDKRTPSCVHNLHLPSNRSVEFRVHCVMLVCMLAVKTWLEGTDDIPYKNSGCNLLGQAVCFLYPILYQNGKKK